jgi:hypothetical protein
MAAGLSGRTFMLWFGGIWLAIGLPFLILGVHFGIREHELGERLTREGVFVMGLRHVRAVARLARDGTPAEATVTGVGPAQITQGSRAGTSATHRPGTARAHSTYSSTRSRPRSASR